MKSFQPHKKFPRSAAPGKILWAENALEKISYQTPEKFAEEISP